mgnify:CR=1 FL=1
MDCTGRLTNISTDWQTGRFHLTFEVNEKSIASQLDEVKDIEKLSIKAVKYREKRSLDANRLLWLCIGRIAAELKEEPWNVYLMMLKRYGKFTYIVVKENAVDAVKAQWRETEVVGEITVNGQKAIQMLCYFGSSTYDTKTFSNLLEGVISELKEMGLETPLSEEVKAVMERYEQEWQKRNK